MTTRIRKSPSQLFPLIRHLSYFLTTHLLKTAITPNQITLLSLIFGLLCGACFISGSHFFQIAGAIFFILSYVMDNCDGEIARIKNMSSEFGAKFDDIVDWLRIMSNDRFRRLPVVDADGKIKVIFTQGDFVSYTWPDLIFQASQLAKASFMKGFSINTLLIFMVIYGVALIAAMKAFL